jgi:alpha-tubulin suppressor-like RCC1 family protein/murein DD-endopeptidase MepM/ murein hydrolase activator NlpD
MGKTRKNNGERKLIFGAVILLIISAILFGLATDQGMNLIKNIQDRVMLKTSITISSANNEALKNKTTEAKIVAGTNHFIALTQDGKVYGWGSNGSGELGQNNTNIYKRPTYLGIDDAIDIAAGYQSTVVLKKDGTVWMAGLNSDGQLGIESTESQSTFVQVKNEDGTGYLTNIKSISAGQYTMFAITNDGEVYGWGENGSGQLGISNTEDQKLPVKTTLTNIKQISTSYYHTIALTEDGKAYVAGRNNEGELGIGQTTSSTITTWTIMKSTNGTSEMTGIKQVATGYMHTVVLTDNGYMYATGNNGYYQLSDGSSTQRKNLVYMKDSSNNTMKDVKEIYAAGNTSVAITNSNGIYVVGENSYAQLLQGNTSTVTRFTKVKNSENIDKIVMTTTTGSQTTAYVDNIGRIFTIGYAGLGQLGDGSLTSSPQYKAYSISDYRFTTEETAENLKAGETKYIDPKFEYGINLINKEFTLDLTYESLDTDVVTVEDNKITAVGIGTTYVKIIDSTNKIYGTVKVNVNADDGVTYPKVVGGYSHFVGLKSDGTVWTWGYNGNGQLGTGDQTNRTEPTKTKVEDAVDVTAGYYFTAILKKDGTVWISGDNTYGQLGDGTTTNSSEFKQVPNLTDVIQISAGSNTMHVLKKDGTVWSWGRNDCGEYGDGTTVSKEDLTPSQMIKVTNVMQIAAGNLHTAVLTAEGTVWAAGRNSDSQLGFVYNNKENTSTPREMQGLSEVKEIACGEYNTLMLQKDGYAYGVGENSDGQLGTGGATTITSPTYMKNSKTGYSLSGIKHIASAGRLLMVTTGENGIYVAGAADHAQNFTESTTKRTTLYQTQTDKKVLAMACTRNISYQTGLIIDEKGRTWTVGYDGQGQVGQGAPEHTTKPVNITKTKISLAENGMISLNQKGDKYQLKHTEIVGLSFLTNKLLDEDIVYSSMDNEVATVDENGVITAVGEGTTYIKVKDQNNEVTNAIKVSVTIKNNETQPKVVGGGYYFAALKGNGTVYTWGYNGSGQLGLGDTNNRTEPTQTNMKAVIDIAAGTDHTLVLKADGTVWATGLNNYGQLGNGTTENTNTFQQVKLNENGDYLENIVSIAAGYTASYAVTAEGEVYGWGRNDDGELGIGSKSSEINELYPVKMKKVSKIIQIAAGANHAIMLDADGNVWSTGYNSSGQLGIGNTDIQVQPKQMTSVSGVKEIAAGTNHSIMLAENGYVYSVGNDSNSQLGNGNSTNISTPTYVRNTSGNLVSDAKHVKAGGDSTYISRKKDTEGKSQGMYVIGYNNYGQLFTQNTTTQPYAKEVEKNLDILEIAPTQYSTALIVDGEGNVYTVGYDGQGQLGNGIYENTKNKICISNIQVKVTSQIINYQNVGENSEKILAKTTIGFNLIKENIEGSTYEFKTLDSEVATVDDQGTVTATGIGTTNIKVHDTTTDSWNAVKVNVNGSENKAQPKVVGGNCHYAALKGNGTVWTWGYNGNGQLGLGDTNARTEPTQAKAEKILEDGTKEEELITDAIDIAASYNHTIILRADGTVWSTGYNQYGELGTGDTEERKIFTQVKGPNGEGILENIVQITTGYYTGYALTTNGEVYGWGSNRYGELGQGSKSDDPVLYPTKMKKVSNIIQISSGAEYIVMLDAEGKVWGTGYNGNGQLGIGNTTLQTLPQQMTSISGIKEISAKSNNTYMLTEGGYVEGVGYNYYSQLGDGSSTDRTTAVYTKNTSNKYVSDAKHISAGENSVFISRKKDSEGNPQGMYVIGRNDYGQLFTGNTTRAYYATEVEKEKDILTMALTEGQTGLIVDTKGNVYTVGYNGQGQIGNGTYENTTEKVFISQVKLNTTPKVINYKKAGDTGEKIEYTVTAGFNLLYEEVEKGECEYKTQDDQIATVDDKGVVTATGTGTTYIKVYNKQNDCYAAVKVQVNGEQGRTAAKIVGGGNHFVALKANGEVWTWGYNGYGQLGIGNTETKNRPTKTNIYNSKDETQSTYAIDVAAGYSHTLVLKSDGTVWAAGYNEYGQLGDSSTTNTSEFVQVTGIPEKVIAITAGGHSSYALTESGKVYGWGYNYEGQLGRGSTSQNNPNATPQKMQKVSNIIQMSAGDNHIVMLDADGTVWSTGHNYYGQLGTNNKTNYSIPQQMRTGTTTVLNNIKKVSAGSLHTLALAENGTVYSLGYNYYGQLGTRNTTNYMLPVTMVDSKGNTVTGVKDIEANGYTSILSIKPTTTGTEGNLSQTAGIYVTGYNNYGQLFNQDTKTLTSLTKVQEDKNIITMASTQNISSQTAAIVDDSGLVYTVGYNGYGAMGNKTTTSTTEPANISEASLEVNTRKIVLNLETNNLSKQIEAKTDLGFNLLIDQVENEEITYKTLDENIATVTDAGLVTGQKYGTTKIEVSTNKLPNKVLIDVQVLRKNDKTIAKTVSGTDFTLALKADGTVWTWGYNGYGQLGLGDNSNRYRPTQINIENVVDIAAGNNHALLVTADGKVYSFGSNSYGQLGRTGNTYTPQEIPNLENIEKVSAGNYHSMAIDKEGNVYTWGYNQNGQLGDGTRISNSIPTKIKLTNITKIATKNNTSAAIDGDGNLYTWGYNSYGQQGISIDNIYTPRKVPTLEQIIDIAVENNTIIVLDKKGEVLSSGYNTYGNLGNNATQTRKSFDKVIEKYETITTGEGEETQTTTTPIYLSGVKSIQAGNEFAVAIKEDGTAISWGYNGYSQSSNGTTTNNLLPVDLKYGKDKENIDKIINVSAGEGTIVVVREDGKVWTIGKNYSGQLGNSSAVNSNEFVCISKPVLLFEETPIRIKGIGQNKNAKVNMSQGFNLLYTTIEDTDLTYQIKNEKIATVEETTGKITAVKKGKTAVTVTDKKSGETTSADVYVLGEEDVTFPQIETQNYSTVTLKSNGEIWSYGYNGYGQLGTGDTTYKVLPTYTGINNITQISLGGTHTLALDTEGHVWSWGYNGYGELGNGTTTSSTEKVQVKSPDGEGVLENIVAISAGNYHSIALDKDGNVYTWGYNGYGQLGLGNTTNTVLPVKVDDLEGIIKIEAGNYTSYVIDNNNHLWSTGYNYYGELGNGSTSNRSKFTQIQTLENVSDVSASETNSTIVLLSDGTVWGFGNNTNNQLTTVGGATPQQLKGPDGMLKDITSISVGYYTGYAITSEEKVLAWGLNNYSQLASGTTETKSTPVYMKEKDGNDFTDSMIVSGGRYSAELAKSDGTVWGVGYNGYGNIGDGTTNSKNQITCISTPHIKLEEREVTLKLSNPNYQINPKTVYGFNILFEETENEGFTYKTSDETIAKIDEATGKVTATGLGKAYITVTAKGTEEETRVVINVIGENKKVEEKVQVGSSHSLALKQDGTIWSWGNNTSAINTTEPIQIEKGKYKETKEIETPEGTTQTTTTEKEIDLNNIKDIAVGYNHNLALDSEGHVYSWGYNGYGQLGDDSTSTKEIPTRIESLEEIEKVYCYKDVSMAINKQGEIYIWGYKYNKTPTKINFYGKAISLNEKLILAEDGSVWNLSDNPSKIDGLKNIVEVTSGENHYAALDSKGKVWVWGYNRYGQLSQGNTTNVGTPTTVKTQDTEGTSYQDLENIVEIQAGENTLQMLSSTGEIYISGYNGYGQLGEGESTSNITIAKKAKNMDQVKNIDTNTNHSIASDRSGFVYTTGYNGNGQLGIGSNVSTNEYTVIGDTYVHVSENRISIEEGKDKQVTATLDNKFNLINDLVDQNNITYETLNNEIAIVDQDGTIHANKMGTVEIIATHTITHKSTTIFVQVVPVGKVTVPKLEIGATHTAALKTDGTVWTWGSNSYGQLGTGDNINKAMPAKVMDIENAIDISVGSYNTVVVKDDGTVWSFGYNGYGQLGDGTSSSRNTPVQVIKQNGKPLEKIVKISAGTNKTIALDENGNVWVWGNTYKSTATKLTTINNAIDISPSYVVTQTGKVYTLEGEKLEIDNILRVSEGTNHALFLTKEGTGYSIGANSNGQLGDGTTVSKNSPTVIKTEKSNLTDIKELKAGSGSSMAIMKNGDTYTWGSNNNNKLGTTATKNQIYPTKLENVNTSISGDIGTDNGGIIDTQGFVYMWGLGTYGNLGNSLYNTSVEPVLVGAEEAGLDEYDIILHLGETHQITVTNKTFNVLKEIQETGTINYNIGNSNIASISNTGLVTGQKEGKTTAIVTKADTGATSIANVTVLPEGVEIEPMALTCMSHTVVLKANGTVWAYGLNSSYELGNGTSISSDRPIQVSFPSNIKITQIAVGNTHNLALDTEGNVWVWGVNSNNALGTKLKTTPSRLGISNVKKIAANNDQSMILTKDGYVYVWGLNSNGELGVGTYKEVKTPTLLNYVNNILDISIGKNHTMLLTTKGKVLTSGLNSYGQTGKTEGKTNIFTQIEVPATVGKISAGDNHSVLLTTNGEVYTFGYNENGQLGLGTKTNVTIPTKTNMTNIMEISAGRNHTVVLGANRVLYSTGSNSNGQLGIGTKDDKLLFTEITKVQDMMSISSGNTYNVAIKYDGNVYGWGDYYHGTASVKTKTNSRVPVKIGNDSSYAEEPEITVNVNGAKQIQITPKYSFNVFKEDNEEDSDFQYESLNEDIATVGENGLVTGVKVGTTWIKVKEVATGKENIVIVRVIESDSKYASKIAGGDGYAAVLKADGSIWGFGYNSDGQLGNDKLAPINVPSQTNILATYKQIEAGKKFTIALREDGTVWAWGDNTYGQLGQGNRVSAKKPVQVQNLTNIVSVAAGDNHAIAIDKLGNVYTWGLNSKGQLGNRTTETVSIPEKITGLDNQVVKVAAGGNLSAIIDSTGDVYVFGDNSKEQIEEFKYNYDEFGQKILPALNTYVSQPIKVQTVENAVKVQCLQTGIVVLKTDGSVERTTKYAKQANAQKTTVINSGMVDISGKNESVVLLDKYGASYTYGDNSKGQAGIGGTSASVILQKIRIAEEKTYLTVGAGYKDNYVIDTEGFVYGAGANEYGQLGNSTYDESYDFTLVGDRNFEIVPDARTMKQPEQETVKIVANIFNVFNHNERALTDYDWKSSNTDVVTVDNGVLASQDMGTATITATDKATGVKATALRVVQPLDEQRIQSITVNNKEAKVSGENKYEVSVEKNLDGTGTLKITTKDSADEISIDGGTTYVIGGTLTQDIPLDTNPTVQKIKVKASNGKTVDYILTINILSNDASLESLTIDNVQATSISSTEYEIIVKDTVTKPEVHAVASDSKATVSIDASIEETKETTKTVDMTTVIKKTIPVQVTSENGDKVTYTLTIYKEDALTQLETITVDGKEATKIGNTSYKATIPADADYSTIMAKTLYSKARAEINELGEETQVTTKVVATTQEQTIVKIYVRAGEGENEREKEYTLTLDKQGTELIQGIFSLTVNGQEIEPIGNIYNAYISENAETVAVTAITINDNDLVKIGETEAKVHISTEELEIAEEETTYRITVTDPEDSTKTKEYILKIRKPSADNSLLSVTVGNEEFSKVATREAGTNNFKVNISDKYSEVDVIGTVGYDQAKVSVNGEKYETKISTRLVEIGKNEPTKVEILVKALNGEVATYTLEIYTENSNTNLKKVTVDGKEATISSVSEDTYEYTLDKKAGKITIGAIAEELTTKVGINTNEQELGATYREIKMEGRTLTVNIPVTAEDGTTKVYKLIINALPDNVNLLNVKVNGKAANAVPVNKYETRVNKNDTLFELYVIPEDEKAKVQIENNIEVTGTASATIAKDTEEVQVKIKVTAQDGTTQEYTLIVTNQSDDCKLAILKVDGETLETDADGKYHITKKYLTSSVNIDAIANNSYATVSINGTTPTQEEQKASVTTSDLENTITITIKAEDGTSKDYTLIVDKLPNETGATITINYEENGETKEKVIELDRNNKGTIRIGNQESVNLKVVAKDELAQISIDGSIAEPKESTKEIITTEETTSVPVQVTGQDGTIGNYEITIIRASNNAELKSIDVKGIENGDILKTSDNTYLVKVPDTMENVDITAIAESSYATVKIADGDYSENNTQNATITMDEGTKEITITIKAENGETKEYKVTIQKVTDLGLESVKIDDNECTIKNGSYEIFIDRNVTQSALKVKPKNPKALISIKQGVEGTYGEEKTAEEHIEQIQITGEETTVIIQAKDPNDPTRIKEYSVTIKYKSNNADLELIQVDGKDAIETEEGYYAVTTETATTARIYVKATNEYAKVTIGDNEAEQGASRRTITLSQEKKTIIQITIKSQDESVTKTFNVIIERKSDDTSCNININNETADEIDTTTNTYTKYIERNDTQATIQVTANNDEATIEMAGNTQTKTITTTVDIASEITEITATVTAENGETAEYHIRIVKKSTDTSIKTVKVDNKVISEVDGKYVATVYDKGKDTQQALIEVTANESHAKIQIGDGTEWQQTPATSTEIFKDGNRKITLNINVQAQDEQTESITKELEINLISDDVSIKVVKNGENVVTNYNAETHTYKEYLSRDIEQVSLSIEANNMYTTITSGETTGTPIISINNISVKDQEEVYITFAAIAESGRTQEYTIQLLRKSSNADAEHIYVDGQEITDRFADKDSVPTCIVSIGKTKDSSTIRVVPENEFASIKIGDTEETIGETSQRIPLDLSNGTITVPLVITSQDGTVTKTYNIMFVRLSNDTKIQWLEVNNKHIIEDESGNYEVTVKSSEEIAKVKIVLSNILAKVTMGGEEKQGQLEENVILPNGDIVKTITVTAIDGTIRTSTLTIHKAQPNLGLEKVYLDGRLATKVDDKTFEIGVEKGTTQAQIKAIASNPDEYVSIKGNTGVQGENIYTNCSLADKEIPIKVTAMFDGEIDQEKDYVLKIKEIEEPDILEDLKVKIKVDDEEVTQGEDGMYLVEVDNSQDNSSLWAEVTTETSQVKIKDTNGETSYDSPSNQKNISLKENITDVTVTVKNGAGEEKEYIVRIQKRQPAITGKVITQASDQANQTATIKVYKTSDTRNENDADNPRELIKEIEIKLDGSYILDLKPDEYDIVVTKTSYLEYRLTNVLVKDGETIAINDIYIYAGDLDENGEIEIEDLTNIIENYGEITQDNKDEKGKYDLNEDGIVNKLDRNILKENYGKTKTTEQWVDPNPSTTANSIVTHSTESTLSSEVKSKAVVEENKGTTGQSQIFVKPLKGKYTITSAYGTRTHPTTGEVKKHTGIDIAGTHHAEVLSIADGEVTYAGVQKGFGNSVEIKHVVNGETIYSFYAHLSKIDVQKGQKVKQGETIGLEGGDPKTDQNVGNSTGHHLHFEIRKASGYGNDIDPTKYI